MPSRYATSREIRDNNGKRRANTTLIPVVPISESDTYIRTVTDERLDLLAYQLYNDATLWWIIAGANGLGKGSLHVPANTRLRIPSANNITDLITSKNTSR